ncbi:hypothetical protein chiPu_0006462 [Chiloscyllium punctatum]|uniref:Uncharacterized protein n=1 Tax=Chiloscyllium punctatum TaxID=137246 RepID=A0A401SC98_CHIPU|nr:hypothetical protein [Chiloscyllium punctatum]
MRRYSSSEIDLAFGLTLPELPFGLPPARIWGKHQVGCQLQPSKVFSSLRQLHEPSKVKPLPHVLGQNIRMRAKEEELQQAIAEAEKLALPTQEPEQNTLLAQEKSAKLRNKGRCQYLQKGLRPTTSQV